MRFEPSGFTNNKEIPIAKSVLDYIFRWLSLKFLAEREGADAQDANARQTELFAAAGGGQAERLAGIVPIGLQSPQSIEAREKWVFQAQADAPACYECGSLMVRSGSCYRCNNCGSTSGCS